MLMEMSFNHLIGTILLREYKLYTNDIVLYGTH